LYCFAQPRAGLLLFLELYAKWRLANITYTVYYYTSEPNSKTIIDHVVRGNTAAIKTADNYCGEEYYFIFDRQE
jgi:hypothetical protein